MVRSDMDKQTWQFINTFAPWFSALGTISAVITSLYLATKNRRLDLKVQASMQTIVQTGVPPRHCVGISVVNMGGREATITSLGWRFGLFRKTNLLQVPGIPQYSSTLPARLRDGESATFLMPVVPEYGGTDWVPMMKEHLGKYPRLNVYTLKAVVATSVGKTFLVRVDWNVRKLLTE